MVVVEPVVIEPVIETAVVPSEEIPEVVPDVEVAVKPLAPERTTKGRRK